MLNVQTMTFITEQSYYKQNILENENNMFLYFQKK